MACSCSKGRPRTKYEWTSEDGTQTEILSNELIAKAKVRRHKGSYKPVGPA